MKKKNTLNIFMKITRTQRSWQEPQMQDNNRTDIYDFSTHLNINIVWEAIYFRHLPVWDINMDEWICILDVNPVCVTLPQ